MNYSLLIAGVFCFLAAVLHLVIIYKGTTFYEFFHAGERMVNLSKEGSLIPASVTLSIALVLFIWALYAFSGAKIIVELPFIRQALITITSIYLLRGLAIIPLYLFYPEKSDSFMIWSSGICLIIGLLYFIGMYRI